METKSVFSSVTIWGLVLSTVCSFIHGRTGVNVADQVKPIQDATAGIVAGFQAMAPALGQLAGAVMVLVGRFRARQPLHVFTKTLVPTGGYIRISGAVSILALAAALAIAVSGLTGCGTSRGVAAASSTGAPSGTSSTGTTTGSGAAAVEASLPLVRTGAAVATGAVLDFAVQQSTTRTRLANEMYAAASAVYSLSGGTFPTPAQFSKSILAFGGTQADASYAQFASAISALYSAYFPKLVQGDSKTATDLLNAIAGGIEDATASYVSTPAAPSTAFDLPPAPVTFEPHPVARDDDGALVYSF